MREIKENGKLCIAMKMGKWKTVHCYENGQFFLKINAIHSFDFRNDLNIKTCSSRHAEINLKFFFIDICPRCRSCLKIRDLNICVQT